ncbi:MAG: hypothetical protein PHP01_05185, partial [Phycisphaerae bacterium]|nr:hypothetical protein [Phycisphaerae bacterium]
MTDIKKIKQIGLDKIAFLILLIAGLICAKLIVSSRSSFKLSKPVSLNGTGLSVSIPAGGGFMPVSDGFSYIDNEFRLGSILQIGRNTAISVHWRYFILPAEQTPSEKFGNDANSIDGIIESSQTKQFDQFSFDCVKIVAEKKGIMILCGTTQLSSGRTLTLEVMQKGRDFNMANKIFNTVIESVSFKAENPLTDGIKFLDNFRQKNLAEIIGKKNKQNYYYIQDFTNKILGFATDAAGIRPDSKNNSIVAASLYFLHSGRIAHAEQDLFTGELNINTFKWANSQSNMIINREIPTSIELDAEGIITVHKTNGLQNFKLSSSMLPEMLFDTFVEDFLHSDFNAVMVDMILSDGSIKPAIIKKADPNSDPRL